MNQTTLDRQEAGKGKKDEIIIVAPNGAPREIKFHPNDTVQKTLDKAVKDFGKDGQLDLTGNYNLVRGASPLEPGQTLHEAGVQPGDRLIVQAKAIPVDGDAPAS